MNGVPETSLPDFYVIGAQKAATTSLFAWLSRQYYCNLPRTKEPHFFSDTENFSRGLEWYLSLFDSKRNDSIRGDIDPDYLCSPESAERISLIHGENTPRFVVLLRNPYNRARSHWQMASRKGLESRELHQAFAESYRNRPDNPPESDKFGNGFYTAALDRYIAEFGQEFIMPVIYEDLVSREKFEVIFKEICKFIGLREISEIPTFSERHNIIGRPRSKTLMKMIYDKENPIKKFVGKLIPSDELKIRIARFIVRANSSSVRETLELNLNLLPSEIIQSYSEMSDSLIRLWPDLRKGIEKWNLTD